MIDSPRITGAQTQVPPGKLLVGRDRGKILVVGAIGMLVFYYAYRFEITPTWGYAGLRYLETPTTLWISLTVGLLPLTWLPPKLRRPSDLVEWALYGMVVIPASLIPAVTLTTIDSVPLIVGLVGSFAAMSAIARLAGAGGFRGVRLPQGAWLSALYGFTIFSFIVIILTFGFRFSPSVILGNIYEVRLAAREKSAGFVSYILLWQGNVVNPVLMLAALHMRRWFRLVAVLLFQIVLFSVGASKALFFAPVLVFAVYRFARSRRAKRLGISVATAFVLLMMGSLVVDSIVQSQPLTGLVVRRMFAVPGLLTGYYYDYYSKVDQVELESGTNLADLLTSNKSDREGTPETIGRVYFGDQRIHANANVWADGYAKFGWYGLLGAGVILGLFLALYNRVARGVEPGLAIGLMAMPMLTLANSGVLTALVSHGFLLVLLILMCAPPTFRSRKVEA